MTGIDILLVEDNPGDVHLIERAFEDRDLPGTIHSVRNGEDALDWLYGRGEFAGTPRPDIVLLDLNLPDTGGREVLREIRTESRFSRLPVVVLTGSRSDEDIVEMYDGGANAYLVKPTDPNAFGDRLERFAGFWLEEAVLPPSAGSNHEGGSTDG